MRDWNKYNMGFAQHAATGSKDPSSQVGAYIVDEHNQPVSNGFNGFVSKCDDKFMTYDRPLKYELIIHAEMNAVDFANRNLKGCKLYCTHGPCANCLKHVLQKKIREIYYLDPGIVRDRGTDEQKEAIRRLILGTGAIVKNIDTGKTYLEELGFNDGI